MHVFRVLVVVLMGVPLAVMAQQVPEPPEDHRRLVEMPDLQIGLMREDMQQHLVAYQRILGLMAEGRLAEAGEVAEATMGISTMGKHAARTQGLGGPGRHMPDSMRQIGLSMHEAATNFAAVAATEDLVASLKALHELTATCVACHMSYRTR